MKKWSKQLVLGGILFVLGGMVIPSVLGVIIFMHAYNSKPLTQFAIPGHATVSVKEAGRYYLWNDYQTIFEGKTYSCSEDFPGGIEISLFENNTGIVVDFIPDQSISSSCGKACKNSIGYFDVDEPANYVLTVDGNTETRICSLDKAFFTLKKVLIFLTCFVFEMSIGITGFVFIVLGVINLCKSRKKDETFSGLARLNNSKVV